MEVLAKLSEEGVSTAIFCRFQRICNPSRLLAAASTSNFSLYISFQGAYGDEMQVPETQLDMQGDEQFLYTGCCSQMLVQEWKNHMISPEGKRKWNSISWNFWETKDIMNTKMDSPYMQEKKASVASRHKHCC
ncbi:unnamed protein product [Natator depressus]